MLNVPAMFGADPKTRVVQWLAAVLIYTNDKWNPRLQENEQWPTRSEIEGQWYGTGRIRDDCDGNAFAAVYALADFGIKARVVRVWTEAVFSDLDGETLPRRHMIAQDEFGNCYDNRVPSRLVAWAELDRMGYKVRSMSGYFEFGEEQQWTIPEGVDPDTPQ